MSAMVAATKIGSFLMLGGLLTRFIHPQGTSTEYRAFEVVNCLCCFLRVRHFYKSEPSRLAGITVEYDADRLHGSKRRKGVAKLLLGGCEVEIADEDIDHKSCYWNKGKGGP